MPQAGFNGGVPIGSISTPYVSTKHTELNTILSAFGNDGNRVFLGMLKLWNQYEELPTPMLNLTEMTNAIIYTPTMGSSLDFAVPYKLGLPFVKYKDVDELIRKPGYAGSYVPLILSEDCYTNGDRLTNDLRNGEQVIVSHTVPVVPFSKGDGFVYMVTPASDDPEAFIPHHVLEPGVRWVKIDNRQGEEDTHTSSLVGTNRSGIMQLSHQTGNSEISIGHSIKSYADFTDITSLKGGPLSLNVANYSAQGMSPQDRDAILNYGEVGPDGKLKKGSFKGWMPTIIDRMMREFAMMKEHSMTWAKSYSFRDAAGKRYYVPKGYYQWIKQHGSYHTYSSFRELPNLLKNIMGQLFANRKGLPVHMRRVKFKMGMGAEIELQKAWMEQFKASNPFQIVNDGRNPQLQGMLSGSYDALKFKNPRVVSYEFPEVGTIEIEHSAALDYIDDATEIRGHTGALPNSSYMIFVEDITEDGFSNMLPKGAEYNVSEPYNNGSNIVQVKPKNYYDTINFIAGSGCNPTLRALTGQNPNSQVVSTFDKGFHVRMLGTAEIFVKDPSRTVLIEYVPNSY